MDRGRGRGKRALEAGAGGPGPKFCKKLFSLRQDDFGCRRVLFAWQESGGTLLASSVEGTPVVRIHNRQGEQEGEIPLMGNCVCLSWDPDGDFLAIVCEGSSSIFLWEAHGHRLTEIDSSLKDSGSCLAWAAQGKVFAYGTVRGNLLIYNHHTLRKVPIIGKQNKKILCSAWSNEGILALGTADNVLSLSDGDGDPLKTIQLRGKPLDLKFGHLKEDQAQKHQTHNTVSLVVGEKTLYLLRLENAAGGTPLELGFQGRYGNLVGHSWLGDGYILAAFSAAFLVTISTHHKEIGTEILLVELNEDPLRFTHLCPKSGQVCICYGDSKVELREAMDPKEARSWADVEDEVGRLSPPLLAQLNADGQLLAVGMGSGDIHVFLTAVPLLGGASANHLLHLSSLAEATLHALPTSSKAALGKGRTLRLDVEPTMVLMGPAHFALALNNRLWLHRTEQAHQGPPLDRPFAIKEYHADIRAGALNAHYAAILAGERLCLHPIESEGEDDDGAVKFFQEKRENRINCLALTKDFLFFGTEEGSLRLFHLDRWEELKRLFLPGKAKVRGIFPDASGTRLVVSTRDGLPVFYDMRLDVVEEVSAFPPHVETILWEQEEGSRHVFLACCKGASTVDVFIVGRDARAQADVAHVQRLKLFATLDHEALCLRGGVVFCQTSTGRLTRTISIYSERPEFLSIDGGKRERLEWLLRLRKFSHAARFAKDEALAPPFWLDMGRAAVHTPALPWAKRGFSRGRSFGLAFNMAEFLLQDDLRLQHGHMAALFQRFDEAETSFLKSSDKLAALRMRVDLRQWEESYHLATELAPDECSQIALRFAEQDELAKNFSRALESFTNAATYAESYADAEALEAARVGIGRNCLRCGQVGRGMALIATPTVSPATKTHCAEILETTKFLTEAAQLYEEAGRTEKAAALFIRTKNWDRLQHLLPALTTNKLLLQYAKSREVEGSLSLAAEWYARGGDVLSAVRLCLRTEALEKAMLLVKESGSREGGALVAAHFLALNQHETAMRFLLLARQFQDAVQLAFTHGLFDLFAQLVETYAEKEVVSAETPHDVAEGLLRMAHFYEGLKDHFKAAKFAYLGGDVERGFRVLLRAGGSGMVQNEEDFLSLLVALGVEAAASPHNAAISTDILDFLLGDKDGNPKDAKFLLRFYAQGKREAEAVKTLLIFAGEELRTGSLDKAHDAFVETMLALRTDEKAGVPIRIYSAFRLIHFCSIAKLQSQAERAEPAARLLKIIYPHHQAFPQQAAEMLTLSVVECSKGGLKATALEACSVLMQSETLRSSVDTHYRKKFELLVRRRGKQGAEVRDAPEGTSPCPNCAEQLPDYSLHCQLCRTDLPFCIFSGRHLLAADFTYCPFCRFPAIYSELIKLAAGLLRQGHVLKCPLCRTKPIPREAYRRHHFASAFLGNWLRQDSLTHTPTHTN